MQTKYDAIVIGSGFGGSVMALRLSEKGKKVCLLERGRQWTPYDFPRQFQEALLNFRIMQLDKVPLTDKDFPFLEENELRDMYLFKEDGLYEFKRSSTGMHAMVANGVGGGSLIYACVLMETPPAVFKQGWPSGVNWPGVLDYQRVKNELVVHKAILPGGLRLPKTSFLEDAHRRTGRGRWDMPDLAHQPLDDPNPHKDIPCDDTKECISCGNCVLGCRRMAKNTLDSNYIKKAVENGAHLYPCHEVTAIERLGDEGYLVICEKQHRAFEAKIVVLAGGTFGTTKLLLQCKRNGTLPNISDELGKKFSANGDFQAGALQVHGIPAAKLHVGPTITSAIDFSNYPCQGHIVDFVIEDGGVPELFHELMALIGAQMGEIGYLKKLLKNFDFSELAGLLKSVGRFSMDPKDTLNRSFMFLCAGRDGADGRIVLKEDGKDTDVIWNWENPQSQALYKAVENELRHLVEEGMGGAYFPAPIWELVGHLITVHPLGGCPMGSSKEEGVVNSEGEVFGYPGLYVADGSIIPTALGVNPSLTIAALAERIADNIP